MYDCKTLIISSSESMRESLSSIALDAGITHIAAADGNNVREVFARENYSLVIMALPLEEEFGLDTAVYISRHSTAAVAVFVPHKTYPEVCRKLSGTGITALPRSVQRELAVQSVSCAAAVKAQLDELREENRTLTDMLGEIKLVNRAKCVLIEYLRISERDAHKQLQKRAMDSRTSLSDVAADILKTYEYRNN